MSVVKCVVPSAGERFFPLDERLALLPGSFTPQVQEAMTRLGSRLTYGEAQEEMALLWGVQASKGTLRNTTMRYGHRGYQLEEAEARRLAADGEKPTAEPDQLVMSVDGSMVATTSGDWREVKLVAFGQFAGEWQPSGGQVRAKSASLSYFARLMTSAEFEQAALLEWQRRGGENARRVVAVNDGARWIQSFIDYHCPQAIRVLDFAHAQGYLATIGKAAFGEGSERFHAWFDDMSKHMGQQPPQRTLGHLRLLQQQTEDTNAAETIDGAIRYLQQRLEMIDYPHFRQIQVPIGSGIGESAHKVVVQRRMKQAGMRWAEHNINPMLTLRAALCNGRWSELWQKVASRAPVPRQSLAPPPQVPTAGKTPVTEKDYQRLERLRRRTKRRHPWRNHNWLFPQRRSLPHRN